MSRSFRHHPIIGFLACDSEKEDKELWHRRFRRRTRQLVNIGLTPPEVKEASDPWLMSKDGKFRFDPKRYPQYMRH